MSHVDVYPDLAATITDRIGEFDRIPEDRRSVLGDLAQFVRMRASANETTRLTFICTHNSRRSQMGQLWGAAAAAHFGIEDVRTYSGGTEVTAFNPRAVEAMRRAGFVLEPLDGSQDDNPHYRVTFADEQPPLECFSKVYDDPFNPADDFAALMTCGEADEACPVVLGAKARIALRYVDPKTADDTPNEAAAYDERSDQIATEMLYVFSKVA
jgi:arsenate reductase